MHLLNGKCVCNHQASLMENDCSFTEPKIIMIYKLYWPILALSLIVCGIRTVFITYDHVCVF